MLLIKAAELCLLVLSTCKHPCSSDLHALVLLQAKTSDNLFNWLVPFLCKGSVQAPLCIDDLLITCLQWLSRSIIAPASFLFSLSAAFMFVFINLFLFLQCRCLLCMHASLYQYGNVPAM